MPHKLEPATSPEDYAAAVEAVRSQVQAVHAALPPETLPMWVVFGPGTTDQSGLYVARLWLTLPKPTVTNTLIRAASLEEVRSLLPAGLARLERSTDDDPNIVEVWM